MREYSNLRFLPVMALGIVRQFFFSNAARTKKAITAIHSDADHTQIHSTMKQPFENNSDRTSSLSEKNWRQHANPSLRMTAEHACGPLAHLRNRRGLRRAES